MTRASGHIVIDKNFRERRLAKDDAIQVASADA